MRLTSEKVKTHLNDHRQLYIGGGVGIGIAVITYGIMRGVASQHISRGISVTASRGISVAGKRDPKFSIRGATIVPAKGATIVLGHNNTLNTVSYISSNRKGSPSWVVRCLENGEIFTSQKEAALQMSISPSVLSSHLNGFRDHVDGYHFERICMAA